MDLFQSFYDRNGDGKLTDFERVHYEEDNWAYPGSLVPHKTTTDSLLRKDFDSDEDNNDEWYSRAVGYCADDDASDDEDDDDDIWDDDEDDDWDDDDEDDEDDD